mmetsp:Transcript_2801/g.2463  ORF Transcript_2801/g.2463 Transcript_2801/m.2463 type:complete len:577 (-) Transcript_2801:15-1745(-)
MGFEDLFIDVSTLPHDIYGFIQLLTLGGMYGYLLMFASNLISDGSELLLLVPSFAGLVGSVVLPVLGAVPDGCIVLFSGLGPDAQEQLSVGVGALAGSTIMLLTIPWFLAIYGGRVDIIYGEPKYKGDPKLSNPLQYNIFTTGVGLSPAVNFGAFFMILTTLPYLILQIPGLVYLHESDVDQRKGERPWAIAGLVVCLVLLATYLYYQYVESQKGLEGNAVNDKRDEILKESIKKGQITLLGLFGVEFKDVINEDIRYQKLNEQTPLSRTNSASTEKIIFRLKSLLKPFFKRYDRDGSDTLDIDELASVFHDLGEEVTHKELKDIFVKMDTDNSGTIEYEEFVQGTAEFVLSRLHNLKHKIEKEKSFSSSHDIEGGDVKGFEDDIVKSSNKEDDEEDDDEDEEVPEDLAELSPAEQQIRIKFRSFWMMGLGTAIVLIVSDPMVDVLSELGTRTNIAPFYVAFVLAPLASNASEVIASYNYAKKKTTKTMSVSLSALEGAAILNNTFVLGIFMLLVVARGLIWEYLAETLTILLVEIAVAAYAYFKSVHTIFDGFFILSLYPLSIGLVALLEYLGWD